MRLFFSAGEASGDDYGAAILRKISELAPGKFQAEAVGMARLESAGAKIIADSRTWGVISIIQSLKVYPRCLLAFQKVKKALRTGPPGIAIPIDFGFFNVRFAKYAKSHGWKVVYFSPPGAYRKDRQGKNLPELSDAIVTPFPWSCEILKSMGANAYFFGHPMKEMVANRGAARDPNRIGLLPGSRHAEIGELLPVLADAVRDLPHVCEFAVAQTVTADELRRKWAELCPGRKQDLFTEGDVSGVLSRSLAAVCCSGTVTLTAAICQTPQVVVYRVTKAMEREARLLRFKPGIISQPNILLGRVFLPELIQHEATGSAIRKQLEPLLTDSKERQAQLDGYAELSGMLGGDDAITQTAQLILEMAN